MSLVRKFVSLKAVALFLAGFLTVPVAAQQEVSPEHFDQKPSAARTRKPSPQARKAMSAKNKQSASNQGLSAMTPKKGAQPSSTVPTVATTASIQR